MPQVVQLRGNGRSGSALAENQLLMRNLENNVADNVKRKALQLAQKNELQQQFASEPERFSNAEATIDEFGGINSNQELRDAMILKRNDLSQPGYSTQESELLGPTPQQQQDVINAQNQVYGDPTTRLLQGQLQDDFATDKSTDLPGQGQTTIGLLNQVSPPRLDDPNISTDNSTQLLDVNNDIGGISNQSRIQGGAQFQSLLPEKQNIPEGELVPQAQANLIPQPNNTYQKANVRAKTKEKTALNVDYTGGNVDVSFTPGTKTTTKQKANIIDENPFTYESQSRNAKFANTSNKIGQAYGGGSSNQYATDAQQRAAFLAQNQGLIGVEQQASDITAPKQTIRSTPAKITRKEMAETQVDVLSGAQIGNRGSGGGKETKWSYNQKGTDGKSQAIQIESGVFDAQGNMAQSKVFEGSQGEKATHPYVAAPTVLEAVKQFNEQFKHQDYWMNNDGEVFAGKNDDPNSKQIGNVQKGTSIVNGKTVDRITTMWYNTDARIIRKLTGTNLSTSAGEQTKDVK